MIELLDSRGSLEALAASPVSSVSPARPARWVDPLRDPSWDDKLTAIPGASFFQGSGWARVLNETYGHRPLHLYCDQDPRAPGVLATFEVCSPLTGRRGVSVPFADACPLTTSNRHQGQDFLQQAIERGRIRGWRYFESRGLDSSMVDAPASVRFHGHHIDLSAGEERVYQAFDSSVRRAIRKAEKSGVETAVSTGIGDLMAFYKLHCRTRRRHGVPPQSELFFGAIHRHILARDAGCVVIVRHQRQPVAGAVFFQLGNEALYKFAASDASFQSLRGNNLVMWQAAKWFSRKGCQRLSLGRTSLLNEGLRSFKRSFGAVEALIHYHRFDYRRGTFVAAVDAAHGPWNGLCKRLPVRVLRWMGQLVYPHLS